LPQRIDLSSTPDDLFLRWQPETTDHHCTRQIPHVPTAIVRGERSSMEPKAKMITGAEVAELFRVSRETVYRLAARGKLPAQKVGRVWRFPRHAIEEFALQIPSAVFGDAESGHGVASANARE